MDYTIPNLFLSAFGLKVETMYRPELEVNSEPLPAGLYSGIQTVSREEASELSYLGTPIIFPITFLAGTYKRYQKRTGEIEQVKMGEYRLPAACVVSFKRSKIVRNTRMSAGYGTVKEIYGFEDYLINISGFFLPDPLHPQGFTSPVMQEEEMVRWDELADAIEVSSEIFNSRDIQAITIEDFNVVPERGKPGIRPFTIRARSDEDVQLILAR